MGFVCDWHMAIGVQIGGCGVVAFANWVVRLEHGDIGVQVRPLLLNLEFVIWLPLSFR